jgi:predicted CoA-binding protein
MTIQEQIQQFLASPAFGVVGASTNREKYGNKILRCYLQHGKNAIPINPGEARIEGVPCAASISDLSPEVESVSMITPPAVTLKLVPLAIEKGIKNIWMQPGAEHPEAVALCRENGINVIADGSCLLVVLGYSDH